MATVLVAVLCILQLATAEVPWWKSSILYQIYPRSYADSNGDGSGDLIGIKNKIPYLKDLGVGIVWLSPIYKSPLKDMGYDISDYRDVNPVFGTLQDVQDLINEVHKHDMKIFLDFVPNHSSNEHPWFNASRYRLDGKDDFYIWRDPKTTDGDKPVPPNNWVSMFGGSAWTYDEVRKQFYLHQFGYFQPDLNYRNPKVLQEMKDNMKFWFEKGIDGFRIDAVPFLVEDEQYRDEPIMENCQSKLETDCYKHIYTQNDPYTYEVMKSYDDMLGDYDNSSPKYFFLEVYADLDQTVKYYRNHSSPFNFNFITQVKIDTNAKTLKNIADSFMASMSNATWPNWVVGNHDQSRVGTRMGPEMIDAMNLLVLMLPGSAITYQGEELGMVDTYIRPDQILDVAGRDPQRTPIQWDRKRNSGFSNAAKTWLPVNPNFYEVNAESEKTSKSSHLNTYKRLTEMRKHFIDSTDLETQTFGDWVFGFKRTSGDKEYYVIINLNNVEEDITLNESFKKIPSALYVHTPSINSRYSIGDEVKTGSKITLMPRSGLGLASSSAVGMELSLAAVMSSLWLHILRQQ